MYKLRFLNYIFGEHRSRITINEFVERFKPKEETFLKKAMGSRNLITLDQNEFMQEFGLKLNEMNELMTRSEKKTQIKDQYTKIDWYFSPAKVDGIFKIFVENAEATPVTEIDEKSDSSVEIEKKNDDFAAKNDKEQKNINDRNGNNLCLQA